MTEAHWEYDVEATETESGEVHVTVTITDNIDCTSGVEDLGLFPDHATASQAAAAVVAADLEHFADLGGKRS